jgi:two-component system, cell cycle sensor histidine kinase and response regulator CckA
MMRSTIQLLLVEDAPDDEELLLRALRKAGLDVRHQVVDTRAGLETALQRQTWDIVVTDFSLPQFTGLEAAEWVRERGLELPVVLVSGVLSEEQAIEAMRAGIRDFVPKSGLTRLGPVIEREVSAYRARLQAEAEREWIEQRLRRMEQLGSIGRVAGAVAHDFNNLLTVIQAHAELLREDAPEHSDNGEEVAGILDAVRRAGHLTNQLLSFSRKSSQTREVVDLNRVIRDAEAMLRGIAKSDVHCEFALAPELWPVEIDVAQMGRVLVNLVLNAREAMPEGGRLTVETRNVAIDEPYVDGKPFRIPVGEYALLSLTDTGEGMDEATRSHIFEPFFTTKTEGTGLGLASVYGIVTQSRGHILAYSEVGRGTTFKVYLPRADQQKVSTDDRRSRQAFGGRETVLVVDDDAAVRLAASRILRRAGYEVFDAGSGGDALRLAEPLRDRIHLLIADLHVPQVVGAGLASQLDELSPGLPVLYVSGHAHRAVVANGLVPPQAPFLTKPFTSRELLEAVRNVLDAGFGTAAVSPG